MMRFAKFTVATLACLLSVLSFAQTYDVGAIGSIGVSKAIGRSIAVNLDQELRFNTNLTELDRSATSASFDFALIPKFLKVEAGYDLLYQNKVSYYEFKHRAAIGLSVQKKLSLIGLKFRTKLQSTWRDETMGDYKFNPKAVWRNKLECNYTIFGSSVKPFTSAELFCPINSANGFFMDGLRLVVGAKYRTSARTTLDFYVRYDQDIQQPNPKSIVYGGIGWNYKL